jgi:hypothetical protein
MRLLDCQLLQRECNSPSDDDAHLCFLANYFYTNNPYRKQIAAWQMAAEQMFRNVNLLQELFVTRSGLLSQCNEPAREAIRKRWGDEIFAAVYQN